MIPGAPAGLELLVLLFVGLLYLVVPVAMILVVINYRRGERDDEGEGGGGGREADRP